MQITIIGAGAGISSSVAHLFGEKGYAIVLIARNEEKLKTEVANLAAKGIKAIYAVADAGDEGALNEALDKTQSAIGVADMILYNAYMRAFKNIEKETWESIQQQLEVNVGGAFRLLKRVGPDYKKENKGKLFFTGGGLSIYPQPNLIGLGIGKAALRNLVQAAAASVKGTDIHIATLTVCGFVNEKDPKYNPAAIAQEYWKLFNQSPKEFSTEVIY